MMSYLVGFAVIGLGMMTAGFNLAVTIINYRAPGMTWSRIPIFVWSILATCALLILATPTLVAAGLFGILDHTAQTAFYVTEHGGSSFLWQNLFWFFGHPEVYIMALPGIRHRRRDAPGLHPKTAVRLQGGRGRHGRGGPPVVLRLAAPPVPERDQPGHAPAVHVDHRADLHPDRVHLPGRTGHAVQGEDPVRGPDAASAWPCSSTS